MKSASVDTLFHKKMKQLRRYKMSQEERDVEDKKNSKEELTRQRKFTEIRKNPDKHLNIPSDEWIKILSYDYTKPPPNTEPFFESEFVDKKKLIQNYKDLWKKERKKLIGLVTIKKS
tara:strand:- start:225 stop:575 length:351 start_codon:yes stop_codon:yes gene_type:complete